MCHPMVLSLVPLLLHAAEGQAPQHVRVDRVTHQSAEVTWRPGGSPTFSRQDFEIRLRRLQPLSGATNEDTTIPASCTTLPCFHVIRDLAPARSYALLVETVTPDNRAARYFSEWVQFETETEPLTRATIPAPGLPVVFDPRVGRIAYGAPPKFAGQLCARLVVVRDAAARAGSDLRDYGMDVGYGARCYTNATIGYEAATLAPGLGVTMCDRRDARLCGPARLVRMGVLPGAESRGAPWFSWPPWAYALVLGMLLVAALPWAVLFAARWYRKRHGFTGWRVLPGRGVASSRGVAGGREAMSHKIQLQDISQPRSCSASKPKPSAPPLRDSNGADGEAHMVGCEKAALVGGDTGTLLEGDGVGSRRGGDRKADPSRGCKKRAVTSRPERPPPPYPGVSVPLLKEEGIVDKGSNHRGGRGQQKNAGKPTGLSESAATEKKGTGPAVPPKPGSAHQSARSTTQPTPVPAPRATTRMQQAASSGHPPPEPALPPITINIQY